MSDIPYVHRREAPRHAVSVDCEGVRERGFQLLTRRLLDLSCEGGFFVTATPGVELGEEVWLSFQIPHGGPWMHARAQVVRHARDQRSSEGAADGLGVRFLEVDREDRMRLSRALAGIPPPVPAAARPVDYAGFVEQLELGLL